MDPLLRFDPLVRMPDLQSPQDLCDFLKEGLLAPDIDLKEHGLGTAGGNGCNSQVIILSGKHDGAGQPVSAEITVSFIDPGGYTDISHGIFGTVFKGCRDASSQNPLMDLLNSLVKITGKASFIFCHDYFSFFLLFYS